jgi:opacity protein-like surface antigen
LAGAVLAQNSPPSSIDRLSLEDNFRRGQWEGMAGVVTLFSPVGPTKHRPVLNYAMGNVQAGYMLTDVSGNDFWRGNFELAPEAFGARIFHGPGNYIAGGTLWLRYNFVPPRWRVLPYVQGGAGFVVTDVDHRYDGQDFNFNLDLAGGIRCFIAPRWALNLEYRYQHISNANLGSKNLGINAHGPALEMSWFF